MYDYVINLYWYFTLFYIYLNIKSKNKNKEMTKNIKTRNQIFILFFLTLKNNKIYKWINYYP